MAHKGKKQPPQAPPSGNALSGFLADARVRILATGVVMALFLSAIPIRLWQEQILSGEERQQKITSQSVKRVRLPGRRGTLRTAEGVLIAGNTGTLRLLFFPELMRRNRNMPLPGYMQNFRADGTAPWIKAEKAAKKSGPYRKSQRELTIEYMLGTADAVCRAAGRKSTLTYLKIHNHIYRQPAMPLAVMEDLTPLEAARAMEFASAIPGVELVGADVRSYPEGAFAAQLIGFTGNAPPPPPEERREFNLYVPDVVGRQGAEKAFDRIPGDAEVRGLLGEPGYALIRVNNTGHAINRHIGRSEPLHGNEVFLTIDARAQKLAESLLGGRPGAFVVLDCATGAVLAAASAPAYDLNRFTPVIPAEYYAELRSDPAHPLLNRAMQGLYTPGSIMKVLVALALLNNGHDPATVIECPGYAAVGNTRIRCSSRYGHGELDLEGAIKHSCNPYMIKASANLPVEEIASVMKSAGLGSPTGVEIEEAAGIVPSKAAKARRYRGYQGRWNAFDSALVSIGQGMILLTPLQAANVAAAFANSGVWYRPHLLDRVTDAMGRTLYKYTPVVGGRLKASPKAIETVRRGMFKVVNESGGSGRRAARKGLEICGKTGSAQSGPPDKRIVTTWFIAFVKHGTRSYASALVFEQGVSGGSDCAPLTGTFFQRYLLENR